MKWFSHYNKLLLVAMIFAFLTGEPKIGIIMIWSVMLAEYLLTPIEKIADALTRMAGIANEVRRTR